MLNSLVCGEAPIGGGVFADGVTLLPDASGGSSLVARRSKTIKLSCNLTIFDPRNVLDHY